MTRASGNPKHVPVSITADTSHLSEGDRLTLPHLVRAVQGINPIYLRQMKQKFAATGGIFDRSRGNNFHPAGLTREEFDAYLEQHPKQKEQLLSPVTIVRRHGPKTLRSTPYSKVYSRELGAVVDQLVRAAKFVEHDDFRNFLYRRVMAFLTNFYKGSDVEWVKCLGAPFEIIIGPFESYEDNILGVKRDFEGTLGIVLPDEQKRVERYQILAVGFDNFLGGKYIYTPRYTSTPMTVVDEIVAAGGNLYGFIAMAGNLPNDEDIRQEVGSKKTFFRNVIEAKFQIITGPIAERVMGLTLDSQLFLMFIIGHEICHGLPFRFAGEDFGPLASSLEEAKADVFGVLFMYFLADQRIITWEAANNAAIMCIADGLREIRFDEKEAHGKGSLIKYGWFLKEGAIRFDGGKIIIERNRLHHSFETLGAALYELSQSKSYAKAQEFLTIWGLMPEGLLSIIRSLADLPVDIDPVFDPVLAA